MQFGVTKVLNVDPLAPAADKAKQGLVSSTPPLSVLFNMDRPQHPPARIYMGSYFDQR